MNIPGFTAEASFYRTSGQCQIARQLINSSRDLTSSIYPARLKNEDEGVNCDTCVGGQCAELHCLETSALGDGGIFDPGGGSGGGGGGECPASIPSPAARVSRRGRAFLDLVASSASTLAARRPLAGAVDATWYSRDFCRAACPTPF